MASEEGDVAVLNLEKDIPVNLEKDSPYMPEPESNDDGQDTPKRVSDFGDASIITILVNRNVNLINKQEANAI